MRKPLRLIFTLCFLGLVVSPVLPEDPLQPKYGPVATRLSLSREFIRSQPAPDFWALQPYYIAQPNDASCSVTCIAMLINALRIHRQLAADEELATPDTVLEKHDRERRLRVKEGGTGLSLDELAALIPQSARRFQLEVDVGVVRFEGPPDKEREALRELLRDNERDDGDLVIVNVLQGTLTGDPAGNVGHMLPVAAFNEAADRVLLFDPDRRWYEPYWVSTDTLLDAMRTRDAETGKPRGLVRTVRQKEPPASPKKE